MAREPDYIVRIVGDGEQADQVVGVVGDQVITATPADVGKVVTVAADGSLVLAEGGGGGVTDHGDLTGLTDPDHTIAAVTGLQTALDAKVDESVLDANTVLYATADNTPAALAVAASRIVGRKATGDIDDLTAAEVRAIIGGAHKRVERIGGGNYSLAGTTTTFGPLDATNLPFQTFDLAVGDVVRMSLAFQGYTGQGGAFAFDFEVDRPTSANHRVYESCDNGVGLAATLLRTPFVIVASYVAGEAGVHGFRPVWRGLGSDTFTVSNATSGADDSAILLSVENKGPVLA